jgi:hypothetical protein
VCDVTLTLRRTGLSSPAFQDWADYIVRDDGRDVGRLYEDRHSLPALRWFWSITVYVKSQARDHHKRAGGEHG